MPKFQLQVARQEQAKEPLELTLAEPGLPEITVQMPPQLPAEVRIAQFESALEVMGDSGKDVDQILSEAIGPEQQRRDSVLLFRGLIACVGKERLREIIKAGYETSHLSQLWSVANYYWQNGELPNLPSSNGEQPNGTRSSQTRTRTARGRRSRSSNGSSRAGT